MNFTRKLCGGSIFVLLGLVGASCGPRDYYVKAESGPHGLTTVKKVDYTPEQIAARNEAFGYTPPKPADPNLATVEENWPKLTEEQRASVVRTIKQMAGTP